MARPEIVFDEKAHAYTVNGQCVPSVTQVLGVLDKPALPPWAAKQTVLGVAKLLIDYPRLLPGTKQLLAEKLVRENIAVPDTEGGLAEATAQLLKRRLKRHKLDHFSITDDSIVRGKSVHKALEDWINHRRVPVLDDYPEHHRGYIRGLTRFLVEWNPDFVESELFVASAAHGFAGTRDTVCVLRDPRLGRVMLDLKTSKGVWGQTQYPQLAAYELAGVECGEDPTDKQGIIRVNPDGTYEPPGTGRNPWSPATADDFLAILRAYKQQEDLKTRIKEARAELKRAQKAAAAAEATA